MCRTIVNNPDIILADEPTGALDTETKKPAMSFGTSFSLSLKNLFTKKGRTALTSFAGSIGIIGIALIFAVSQGMTAYINALQEDTLSSYPLTLEAQHMDMGTLLQTFIGKAQSAEDHEADGVCQKVMLYDLVNSLSTMETTENDLASFKEFIETEQANPDSETGLYEAISGVQYTYDMDLLVYTENVDGTIIQSDSQALLQDLLLEYFGMDMTSMLNMSESMMGGSSNMTMASAMTTLWQEMLPGDDGKLVSDLLEKQYDVVYGSWPTEYNEIVLVVDENNEIDDMTLYALGLKSKDDIDALANAAFNKEAIEVESQKWTYEEICDMEFRVIFRADCYTYDEYTGTYTDLRDTQAGLKYLYDNGTSLKDSGIIRPNEDAVSTMLTGSIGYTSELTEYIIENAKGSAAINAQLENPTTDIFTGLPFEENSGSMTDEEKETEFRNYAGELDESGKAAAYVEIMSIPAEDNLNAMIDQQMSGMARADIDTVLVQALSAQMGMSESEVQDYIGAMADEDIEEIFVQMLTEQIKQQYAAQTQAQLAAMETAQLAMAFDMALETYTAEQCAVYYEEILEFSDSSYDSNLQKLGYVDLDSPSSINIYASTFENKDVIEDAITYVLIAFVAVSLIVSSIMIGVITLISV